jgi:hypothetical protein
MPSSALLASQSDSVLLSWHRRLGHLNIQDVLRLGKAGRLDKKVDWGIVAREEVHLFQCQEYIQGKGHCLSSPSSNLRANCSDLAIHVDLWGPAPTAYDRGSLIFSYML